METKLTGIQAQLNSYKTDLTDANDKISELTKQVHLQELEIEQYKHERNTARIELDAVKDLCNTIDIETDKLNAEVEEYSDIRREAFRTEWIGVKRFFEKISMVDIKHFAQLLKIAKRIYVSSCLL